MVQWCRFSFLNMVEVVQVVNGADFVNVVEVVQVVNGATVQTVEMW